MSTKGTVAFTTHDGELEAAVYVHNAGSFTAETFAEFFATVARECGPEPHAMRFFDPSYLAAKFVVWCACTASMRFQGVGVITSPDRMHAHRRFTVRCHVEESATHPEVTEDAQASLDEEQPMTTITIYGASDDLIEVEGCKGADEFSPDGKDTWHADLISPDGGQMRVYARYESNGAWSVAAAQADDDIPFPAWPVRIRAATGTETRYSAVMEIDAPDGTRLAAIHPAPGDGH